MASFERHCDHAFATDPRYQLDTVTQGFQEQTSNRSDTETLMRIIAAYQKAAQHERTTLPIYRPTSWWEEIRQSSLKPVIHALQSGDLPALQGMYRNFYRDPCSTGLISVPYGMRKAFFSGSISERNRKYFLGDLLSRVVAWDKKCHGRLKTNSLAIPAIGNPFGAFIEETLVTTTAPYHHACAQSVKDEIGGDQHPLVIELASGYGGMAYYLLRDSPGVNYLGFDVPESLALCSYFLMQSFPHLKFRLYGEERIDRADVGLLPLWEMQTTPSQSATVTFCSHALNDMTGETSSAYLDQILRMTHGCFLYAGEISGIQKVQQWSREHHHAMVLETSRETKWSQHLREDFNEAEAVFRIATVQPFDTTNLPATVDSSSL